MEKLFDREIYNIVLIHVSRTWERTRVTRLHEEMPLDNIESTDAIEEIATTIINDDMLQEFLADRDGDVWDKFGDGCSDSYIERVASEVIEKEYP
tara:strand:- start:28 stop:312 length:285 start_codon:yes stop_codon:yes gene_type:complete